MAKRVRYVQMTKPAKVPEGGPTGPEWATLVDGVAANTDFLVGMPTAAEATATAAAVALVAPDEAGGAGQTLAHGPSRPQWVRTHFNIMAYGAIGDGISHPLSEFYGTLGAAQAVFPAAQALTDEIDYVAIIKAYTAALAAGGGEVFIPDGTFLIHPFASGDERIFTIGSDLHFRGIGPTSILKVRDNAGDYGQVFGNLTTPLANVRFSDFRIDQNPDGNTTCDIQVTSTTTQSAIRIWKIGRLDVDRMEFNPCTGVNTVIAGADDTVVDPQMAVRNSLFVFRKAETTEDPQGDGNYYYDNSCIYLETGNQIVTGNSFRTTLDEDAFGCIEVHGGRATVTGNVAENFETLVNVVTRASSGYTDTDPSQITITGNSATGAKKGIVFWLLTGKALKGVIVSDNTIHINNADRGTADHWHNNDVYMGIGINYSQGGALSGDLIDTLIADNTIVFQDEERAWANSAESIGAGIILKAHGATVVRAVSVHGNLIHNAPGIAVSLWSSSGSTIEDVRVFDNLIVDAGNNSLLNGEYRTAIHAYSVGTFREVFVEENLIIDTASGGTANGSRSVRTNINSGQDITVRNNPVITRGTGSLVGSHVVTSTVRGTISDDRGDATVTLVVGKDAPVQRFATTLTANRSISLSGTNAQRGDTFRIVRTGLGAFTLAVGALKTIPSDTAAVVEATYSGSTWVLTGYELL